ncbi:hypothetical protein NDR87_22105 [Nocardia sp. CDC159]|uniref:Uncharacterized protein n=1 Tax=Nocardia pulmonis TaxID=2951408 RepID=A0A9X2J1A7_9NOCA|nr:MULTISPECIES: hypothetical protein [Nocardia]MCM6776786.1 hypothetical protein [Nocardia pulmonis]MCM6789065.1 hypothetical protein [Nocardia sp. CDC159]
MRVRTAMVTTLAAAITMLAFGIGTAAAVTFEPRPLGATVSLEPGEAAVVSNLKLGRPIAQLVPGSGWSPAGRDELARTLTWAVDTAAKYPGATAFATVEGQALDPDRVDIGVRLPGSSPECLAASVRSLSRR